MSLIQISVKKKYCKRNDDCKFSSIYCLDSGALFNYLKFPLFLWQLFSSLRKLCHTNAVYASDVSTPSDVRTDTEFMIYWISIIKVANEGAFIKCFFIFKMQVKFFEKQDEETHKIVIFVFRAN